MLALLGEVLSIAVNILGLVQQLLGIAQNTAIEHGPYAIENIAANAANTVNSPTWGNAALHAQLSALQTAVATLQASGSPVTLPTTPPTGYGADPTGVAAYVWAYSLAGSGFAAGDQLDNAGLFGVNVGTARVQFGLVNEPYFATGGTWSSKFGPQSAGGQPIFPTANILPTDTLVSFLDRESLYVGWLLTGGDYATIADSLGGDDFWYTTTITAAEFIVLRDGGSVVTVAGVPPVWPGLANVTLGSPVTIVPLTTIVLPLDGVLIDITSLTTNKPEIPYGDQMAWRYLGALAFVSDNGQVEPWQPLAFAQALYCPRTMAHAAGVVLRADAGIVGTVTPWVAV
jgi:hypothetical protein